MYYNMVTKCKTDAKLENISCLNYIFYVGIIAVHFCSLNKIPQNCVKWHQLQAKRGVKVGAIFMWHWQLLLVFFFIIWENIGLAPLYRVGASLCGKFWICHCKETSCSPLTYCKVRVQLMISPRLWNHHELMPIKMH